jgi:Ca2+-binding EF-hand superfamily protein
MSFEAIVNSIMSKIPVHRLKFLRQELENSMHGLNLEEFIVTATRNMELESEEQLLQTVPELVDLFEVIDINGDGALEWKEFVGFLIDQVVKLGRVTEVSEKVELRTTIYVIAT